MVMTKKRYERWKTMYKPSDLTDKERAEYEKARDKYEGGGIRGKISRWVKNESEERTRSRASHQAAKAQAKRIEERAYTAQLRKEAKAKGRSRAKAKPAAKSFLQNVASGLSSIGQATAKEISNAQSMSGGSNPRKKKTQYVVVGGKAYPKAVGTKKKRKKRQTKARNDFDDYDFGSFAY